MSATSCGLAFAPAAIRPPCPSDTPPEYHARRMRPFVLAAALLVAAPASAAQAIRVSVEELARTSSAVVRGTVTAERAQTSPDGREIFTTYEVRTRSLLRGRAPATVRVVVPGGVVGRVGQRVDAAPTLSRGEALVLFLQPAGPGAFRVNGLAQGKFRVTGHTARPDLSNLIFVRTSVARGERQVEEMPLAELERRVRSTR